MLFDEPTSPRRIDPTIPRSLETVVLKAMAKEPSSRYTTAKELADDLRRFLADTPILCEAPILIRPGGELGPEAQDRRRRRFDGPGAHPVRRCRVALERAGPDRVALVEAQQCSTASRGRWT